MARLNLAIGRVAHPFAQFAKGWGIARSATIFFCVAMSFGVARAQACGANIQQPDLTKLVYPPIARVAHVSGEVVLLIAFAHDGSVTNIYSLGGPPMLQKTAISFVKDWHADSSNGSRECPIAINFQVGNCKNQPPVDLQHYEVCVEPIILSDPAFTITKRRHFVIF